MASYVHLLSLCLLPLARTFTPATYHLTNDALSRGKPLPSTGSLLFAKSKWDSLIDEDYDQLEFKGGPPVPRDMKYNLFNIKRLRDNFDSIRAVGGKDLTNDVYARDPDTDTFWFIGKVARVSDVPIEKAMARQWPMLEEHAARLRPQELFPKWGSLQLWLAPGDSELDVAYNRPNIKFVQMFRDVGDGDIVAEIRNVEIGFQGEVYESGEEGFRTWRTEDGMTVKPEIQSSVENRQPTEAELDNMMEMLNSQVVPDV
mmetsp:Transcript_24756/g.51610  ORF Transcript_24756/g.51610 Transcript_24756/m.51610 type:complete len:258 (-) Transcript_24756:31-804(-)